jgi:citrate lyase synthetase
VVPISSHNFLFLKTSNQAYLIRLSEVLLTTVEKSKLLEGSLTTFTRFNVHLRRNRLPHKAAQCMILDSMHAVDTLGHLVGGNKQ